MLNKQFEQVAELTCKFLTLGLEQGPTQALVPQLVGTQLNGAVLCALINTYLPKGKYATIITNREYDRLQLVVRVEGNDWDNFIMYVEA